MRYAIQFFVLLLAFTYTEISSAQRRIAYPPGFRVPRAPVIRPVTDTVIRGIQYKDHSANVTVTPNLVQGGNFITINSRSLIFQNLGAARDLRVILQDADRPANSFGVTIFRLTNVQITGLMSLRAQIPNYGMFIGRRYHVTVFSLGGPPQHYAYAGLISVQ